MTNITGEKLSVNQIIVAIQQSAKETDVVASHFKAEADVDKARYLFLVEFAASVDPTLQRRFLAAIDTNLKSTNLEYKGKRDSMRLAAPVMRVMREGWYERGRKRLAESGRRVFQAKTVLLGVKEATTQAAASEIVAVVDLAQES